jgi:ABC-type polysaccharide/polyol phosphate export permease
MSQHGEASEQAVRKVKRQQNIALALALIGMAVYFVGGLNDWRWYALAAPYVLMVLALCWLLFGIPLFLERFGKGDG